MLKSIYGKDFYDTAIKNLSLIEFNDLCENLINENNVSSQLVDSFAKKYLSNLDHSASFAANYLTNKSKSN